jgi:hypothetical protein
MIKIFYDFRASLLFQPGFATTSYTTAPPCIAGLYQFPPQEKYEALLTVCEPQPEGKLGTVDPIGKGETC